MLRKIFSVLIICHIANTLYAQNNAAVMNYINKYKDIAISEMNRSGVPASIKLAQGILESGAGLSDLAVEANNHFGIKCHTGWNGPSFFKDDDTANECFRKYNDARQSYIDHTDFLTSRPRYANLFKLDITDYKAWAYELKAAGYATNPKYPELLIKRIEDYSLHVYDTGYTGNVGDIANTNTKPVNSNQEIISNNVPKPENKNGKWFQNGVLMIKASEGESMLGLADRLKIHPYKLQKLNDFEPDYIANAGDFIYLKTKKKRASVNSHIVKESESLAQIAQLYGVRKHRLQKYNNIQDGEEPDAGSIIFLRDKNPDKVSKRGFNQILQIRKSIAEKEKATQAQMPKKIEDKPTLPAKEKVEVRVTDKKSKPVLEEKSAEIIPKTTPNPLEEQKLQENVSQLPSKPTEEKNTSENRKTHVVGPGDTLFNIARRYTISVDELRRFNNITDNTIKLGQTLFVSP